MRKTLMGVSGIAVALTMMGGATFATWSDFAEVNDVGVGAGHLVLNLDPGTSSVVGESRMKLAPGEGVVRDVYIASNDGDSVPDGNLYLTIKNLEDFEDGCTSASEPVAQATEYPGTDCDTDTAGQFSDQVKVGVTSTAPVSGGPAACTASGAYINSTPHTNSGSLNDNDEIKVQLANAQPIAPGDGVCVRLLFNLPQSATNSVQGDSSSFDLLFELEQDI